MTEQRDVTARGVSNSVEVSEETLALLREVAELLGTTIEIALDEAIKEYARDV